MTTLRCWLFGHEWAGEHTKKGGRGGCIWTQKASLCTRCGETVRVNFPNYRDTDLTLEDMYVEGEE